MANQSAKQAKESHTGLLFMIGQGRIKVYKPVTMRTEKRNQKATVTFL